MVGSMELLFSHRQEKLAFMSLIYAFNMLKVLAVVRSEVMNGYEGV
jgi:hypothetical protein